MVMKANSFEAQAKQIVTGKGSKSSKKEALIKLGLRPIDADTLFVLYEREMRDARANNRAVDIESLINSLTFGVEFECVNAPSSRVISEAQNRGLSISFRGYTHVNSTSAYKLVTDSSLVGSNPIECVTPILKGNQGFQSMKKCLESLNAVGAGVNRSTGTHVHIGYADMSEKHYCNVFYNYVCLECLIDSFMAESRRGNVSRWCKSLRNKGLALCNTREEIREALGHNRYFKVNAEAYERHHTIEFRQHQGTLDFEKISMWVRFCLKLVVWSKDNRLTSDVNDIANVPFLNDEEKAFFASRIEHFANQH